jgi:flagellum-specific ATP synthase
VEDLINIGAYVKGNSPRTDEAIDMIESLNRFLRQNFDTKVQFPQSLTELERLFGQVR